MTFKYTIYQIDNNKLEDCDFAFAGYKFAVDHGFSFKKYYKEIYSGEIEAVSSIRATSKNDLIIPTLEALFRKFNINHPADYTGRSLSVSDVVMLDGNYYYVDSFGYKQIEIS